MNEPLYDEAFDTLIALAEQDIGHRIVDYEILKEESERDREQNKLWLLITLENKRQMEICIHAFTTENKQMGIRFYRNYIN